MLGTGREEKIGTIFLHAPLCFSSVFWSVFPRTYVVFWRTLVRPDAHLCPRNVRKVNCRRAARESGLGRTQDSRNVDASVWKFFFQILLKSPPKYATIFRVNPHRKHKCFRGANTEE